MRSWLQQQREATPAAATDAQICALLATLIPHFWQPDMSDGQMESKFKDFCFDLQGVTVKGLQEAVIAYRQDPKSEFFPKPGPFRARCKDDIDCRRKRMDAIGKAEKVAREGAAEDEPPPDDAVIARRKKFMDDVLGKMGKA